MKKEDERKYDYYFQRTLNHIQFVQKNALYLVINHRELIGLTLEDCRELMLNVLNHDRSKFSKIQFEAYIYFSWCKKIGQELTSTQKKEFNLAWENHYTTENHHPEKLAGIAKYFTTLEVVEMMCDLQAMSDEFNESSCRKFFEDIWRPKHARDFFDDFDWMQKNELMEKIIKCFELKNHVICG